MAICPNCNATVNDGAAFCTNCGAPLSQNVNGNNGGNGFTNNRYGAQGGFSDEVVSTYEEKGGTPWLDFHHTVFGMLTDGADVLDDIASVRTGMNDKPLHDVVIETIEIID